MFDQVFWFGDLNYRIDALDRETVIQLLQKKDMETLLQHDQLMIEMAKIKDQSFAGFSEGKITFTPTFKFDVGTNDWDTSEKQRTPAWTDRVLFAGRLAQLVSYNSHPQFMSSDHKPVSGLFEVRPLICEK